jgi:hypothetical protein
MEATQAMDAATRPDWWQVVGHVGTSVLVATDLNR